MKRLAAHRAARAALVLTLAAGIVAPATAAPFVSNGYTLDLDVRQQQGTLHLDGRVEDGPYCRSLHISVRVLDAHGGSKRVQLQVGEAGGIFSRLVEQEIPVKLPVRGWWIEQVEARCAGGTGR